MDKKDIILFYNPNEAYGCFSNWYPVKFTYLDQTFTSSEQFMMYQKAMMFDDFKIAGEILKTDDLDKIKKLGRAVKNYDDKRWSNSRLQIMRRGLRAKFSQNFELMRELINTHDAIIGEAAPYDKIWGIGLSIDASDAGNPEKWKGSNLLGKALMMVRDDLNLMLSRSTNGIVDYVHTSNFPHHFIWNIKIKNLILYPELKETIECYLYSLPSIFQQEENMNSILENKLAEIENEIYSPWHGYEPINGFKELKQDINEMLIFGMLDQYLTQKNEIYFFSKYWINCSLILNL